jgi:type VI secretion system protein ImpF
MAKSDTDAAVTLPLIDRLIDDEPNVRNEPPLTRAQSVRALKAALRRDLEWLLNTRRNIEEAPEAFEFLAKSLFNFGLPDITSLSFNNPKDRNRLLRMLEATIELYEPRIAEARVTMLSTGEETYSRVMRFQIEGMLMMDPAPERITFDTVLQLNSGECRVKGD